MKAADGQGLWPRISAGWHRGAAVAETLGGAILLFIMASTTVDTTIRFLFNRSILGLSELNGLLLVALVFIPLASTQIARGHIRAELLVDRLPPRLRAGLEAVAWTVSLGFFAGITWRSWGVFVESYGFGEYAPGVGLPIWWARGLVPLGCALMSVQLISDIVVNVKRALGLIPPERRAREQF